MEKVKRIQELRRSNAATAIKNKKKYTRKQKYKNKFDNQLKGCARILRTRSGVSLRCEINHSTTRRYPVENVSLFCYNSNTNKKGKLMGNLADEIATYEVGCLYYEVCGTSETFSQEEYDIYGDDYVCPECQDSVAEYYSDSFPMSLEYDEAY